MHGPWFPKIVRLSFIRQVSAVMRSYLISRRLLTDFSSGTVRPLLGNNFLIEGHFTGRVTAPPQSGAHISTLRCGFIRAKLEPPRLRARLSARAETVRREERLQPRGKLSIAEMTLPTPEIKQVKFCHGALIELVFLPVW
jgi:hypothetical protein